MDSTRVIYLFAIPDVSCLLRFHLHSLRILNHFSYPGFLTNNSGRNLRDLVVVKGIGGKRSRGNPKESRENPTESLCVCV